MKKLPYLLAAFSFAFSCFGLWTILNLFNTLSVPSSTSLPGFTRMIIDFRMWLLLIPIPVVLYSLYAVLLPSSEQNSTAFLACVMSTLPLLFFPTILAVLLPCIVLMDQAWSK
jgi:hypothetical protein